MTIDIFDRTTVVDMLRSNCLGTNGTSGVVIGSHKVGKTHLLNHLAEPLQRPADALVCRLDVDLLRATLGPGEQVNDAVFFRFLAGRIAEGLGSWIAEESEREDDWRREVSALEARLAAPGIADADTLDTGARALKSQLRTLDALRKVAAEVEQLLSSGQPVTVVAVARILEQIKRTKRRVVLFIDEFNRMLLEPGLTERVFSFLRGAANEQKVITLGSSGMHLMDIALHPHGDPERRALFNHYYVQRLAPFRADEAEKFLDWLPAGPQLTADERQYLVGLGGGSPYFLKVAFDQFVASDRPVAAKRPQFERGMLAVSFEAGFRALWQRCALEARELLRKMAGDQAVADPALRTLESEGYLVTTPSGPQLFSPLFAEFVRREGSESFADAVEVVPDLRYGSFPTALGLAAPEEAVPIRFRLRNRTPRKITLSLTWSIHGYSLERSHQLDLPAGGDQYVVEPVLLQKDRVAGLTGPVKTQLHYVVAIQEGGAQRRIALETKTLLMLAADHFVFARRDVASERVLNLTWSIAAWVTKAAPELEAVRAVAAKQCRLVGYGAQPAASAQVEALYNALAGAGIQYQNSTMVFHQEPEAFAQRVRLPGQSLREHAANCLDACVLLASLISSIDLHPLILLRPGHAVVGWKEQKDDLGSATFVDVTRLGTADFATATAAGQAVYSGQAAACQASCANPPAEIGNTRDFALLIDVHAEWQRRQLISLA